MTTIYKMKIQQQPRSNRIFANIPAHVSDFLDWKKGDEVVFDVDKTKDSIIITRVRKAVQDGEN